jgi:DNA mismatch repair protein MutS2
MRYVMNARSKKILEFDKIIEILKGYAISEPGKDMIKSILPVNNLEWVVNLLKETEDAVIYIKRRSIPSIDGISNIKNSLRRVELGGILNPSELIKICDNMRVARRLKEHLSSVDVQLTENSTEQLIKALYQNKRLEEKISNAILSEDEISDNASPGLYSVRRQINSLSSNIKDKLNEIIHSAKYQKMIQESVVTLRGDRYVIPIKQEYRSSFPGLIHDTSSSGATIFVEPMAVVEINNNIKQAKAKEAEEIEKILLELTEDVLTVVEQLDKNVTILSKIDFLFAKARFALDYNCICPKINKERQIKINKGRHPLLDPNNVVPIDFWIGSDFSTLVITGPNTGGKTVTLKTVGLFALMTQAGILIPANQGSSMCIFDNVYSDIGDEQSIEQSLSTFSSHMKNIVEILDKAKYGDLVLFDELGAGTDPQEGAALAISILESLMKKNVITVATTHYSELKVFALTSQGVENACCEFDLTTLMPTYKLLIGVPGKSNAFYISEKLGLDKNIIERARKLVSNERVEFEDIIQNLEENLLKAKNEKEETAELLREAQKIKNDMDKQKEKFKEKKDKIIDKAHEEARRILSGSVSDLEKLIKDIKQNTQKQTDDQRLNYARELKKTAVTKIREVNQSISLYHSENNGEDYNDGKSEYLHEGDNVIIKSLNQPAIVLSPIDKNNDVLVLAGSMRMNVNISNLKIDTNKNKTNLTMKNRISGIPSSKASTIKTEADFRGYSIDDAVIELDKYLDDAHIARVKEVRIIHGKGTGVLRSGIQQFLKKHPHVSSYRVGTFGEGENGVTIVEIK